jgi:hypothetical protein
MAFTRALTLARYNWPLYLVCAIGTFAGFSVAFISTLPPTIRMLAALGGGVALWYAFASFAAFHIMFDRPDFLSGQWLTRCIDDSPGTCVQLSVCIEETTLPISDIFPQAICTELDLFDDSVMTEPPIARAKQAAGNSTSIPSKPDALPLANETSQLTVVTLAAHEVRDPIQRESLFQELARITESSGRLIIAEHLRNLPAALAFGPGLFHFYPRSEWAALAQKAGLRIESEFDVTPFFHIFVLTKM